MPENALIIVDMLNDFIVFQVKGVTDFDPEFHRFALKRMARVYAADAS